MSGYDTERSTKDAHQKTTARSLEGVETACPQQATEHRQVGLDPLEAPRTQVLRLLASIERLSRQIDQAFSGQLFLLHLPPTAPANRRRCKAYLEYQKKVTKLLFSAIELHMITCGMKREDDWVPVVLEDMRRNARSREAAESQERRFRSAAR
jgi:hypothetical protein